MLNLMQGRMTIMDRFMMSALLGACIDPGYAR